MILYRYIYIWFSKCYNPLSCNICLPVYYDMLCVIISTRKYSGKGACFACDQLQFKPLHCIWSLKHWQERPLRTNRYGPSHLHFCPLTPPKACHINIYHKDLESTFGPVKCRLLHVIHIIKNLYYTFIIRPQVPLVFAGQGELSGSNTSSFFTALKIWIKQKQHWAF